jgi:hypothetical protein
MAQTTAPVRPGQFIWCNFPYDDKPLSPGPEPHIVYVADVRINSKDEFVAICIYTSSQPWRKTERPPIGVIPIYAEFAATLGQRPFTIDARRIGYLPISKSFFPSLDTPTRGIIPKMAPKGLQNAALNAVAQIIKRPEYLIQLGPSRPSSGPQR